MALISVLIPVHNAATWLQEAVDSIRFQTVRDLEILIYNDGSNDDSAALIERLTADDPRVIPMGEATNKGIVHALNTMLNIARGRYIARMDADDVSLPQRFERQLRFIQAHQFDLCGTWFQEFDGGIGRAVRWHTRPEELCAAMLFQNTICHPTVMARREVFETFSYREGYNLAEDYDLFARALTRFRLTNLPEVLLRYRRHPQQATQARRSKMEEITRRIRIESLQAQGIESTIEEQRVHNLIRAPQSIQSIQDFECIEHWLLKLLTRFDNPNARSVIASQWTRAAVRAAPLGWTMWRKYRSSALRAQLGRAGFGDVDLGILAALRLDYRSPAFEALRRFGISA